MSEPAAALVVPRWIDHNTIMIPATARADGIIGDGAIPITSKDKVFEQWANWLEVDGKPRPQAAV